MVNIFLLLFTFTISCIALIVALVGFNYIWVKQHFIDIPLEASEIDNKNQNTVVQIKSFRELVHYFWPRWREFDTRYWVANVGLDSYAFLYVQREFLKMFLVFGILAWCLFVPLREWILTVQFEQLEKMMVYNAAEASAFVDCSIIYFFSIYCVFNIFKMKRHIVNQRIIQTSQSKNQELEALKARSLHIQGLYPEDRKGELVRSEIDQYLEYTGGGRMLSLSILYDFTDIITLENERKRFDNIQKLYLANEPAMRRACFPKKYRDQQYFESELEKIDNKIEDVAKRPILSSGHAFICLDSIQTKQRCLKQFRMDARGTFTVIWDLIKDKCGSLCSGRMMKRERMTSTFGKFNDEEALTKLKEKELQIVAQALYDPVDIIWSNLGGTRGLFFFRRVVINVGAVLILLFLTTPLAMMNALEKIDYFNVLANIKNMDDEHWFGRIMKEYVPPLMISMLNQLLVMLIDYAAYMEKHATYSLCQLSIFKKSVFYLMLNMLIIPGLTLATADSLFKLIFYEGDNLTGALKNFYFSESGSFFIIFLIQSGSFSSSSRLLRTSEIVQAFGSSWLAHYKRTYLNDSERWRRGEMDIFAYGYFYAQLVCVFTIIMTYSATTPGVILAGIIFFFLRHLMDSYNFLTVHKKEIESSGTLPLTILKYTLGGCCIFQAALSFSFSFNGFWTPFTMTFLLLISTGVILWTWEDSTDFMTEAADYNSRQVDMVNKEDVMRWDKYYSHPLLVSNTELFIQRENRSKSYRLSLN
jgi:hypothetical protein